MTSGIYSIKNKVNNKVYIGSSINVEDRLERHRKELEGKRHPNAHLQRAWDKYGASSFDFILLEEASRDKLFQVEFNYIQKYNSLEKGYNADYPYGENIPRSDSVKHKISAKLKGRIQTEEQCQKNIESNKKRVWSEEHKCKRREAITKLNKSRIGTHHSEETRRKITQGLLAKQ